MNAMRLRIQAFAKVNLSLEVLGRRSDGYHDVATVLQTVSLADTLEAETGPTLSLETMGENIAPEENLVLKAVRAMRTEFRIDAGCALRLSKRIPVGAGLGGGSSDAAAALYAGSAIWMLNLRPESLRNLAATLGSDVPFFVTGGTAFASGRGESIQTIRCSNDDWYVLANPGYFLSTAQVYASVLPGDWTDGLRTAQLRDRLIAGLPRELGVNALQKAACRLAPELAAFIDLIAGLTDAPTLLSGSGATTVSAVGSSEAAASAAERIRSVGYWACAVSSVDVGHEEELTHRETK